MFGALPYLACLLVSNVATVMEVGRVESVLLMALVNLTGVDRLRTLAFSPSAASCGDTRSHRDWASWDRHECIYLCSWTFVLVSVVAG